MEHDTTREAAEPDFGIHFNRHEQRHTDNPPTCANKQQGEPWGKSGVVIGDQETQTITNGTATQALLLLGCLQDNDERKREETGIGEPLTKIGIDEPERDPEPDQANKICLTPELQTPDLSPYTAQSMTNLTFTQPCLRLIRPGQG